MSDPKQSSQVDGPVAQTPAPPPVGPVTSARPDISPATGSRRWDAMTWATVVNSVCTLAALVVALFLGLRSLRVSEDSLRATSESLRQNNLATIYTLSGDLTRFDQENPKLTKFFDKEVRKPWVTEKEFWDEFAKLPKDRQTNALRGEYTTMWEEYAALGEDARIRVYMECQKIADFSQIAFVQQDVLPDND